MRAPLHELIGRLLLVRGGRVRLLLRKEAGGERLDVLNLLALLGRLTGGESRLLLGGQERRELVELLEQGLQVAVQVPLVVGLLGGAGDRPAATAPALAHLLGEGLGLQAHLVLVAGPALQALGRLVERLDRVVLEEQALEVLHDDAVAVVGLLRLVRGGRVVRGLDGGFEVGDDRFHVVPRQAAERLGRVGQELLLFALVEPVVGHEPEHGPEPAGHLLRLALELALGGRLVRGDRAGDARGRVLGLAGQGTDGDPEDGRAAQSRATGGHNDSSSITPDAAGGFVRRERGRSGRRQDSWREGRDPDTDVHWIIGQSPARCNHKSWPMRQLLLRRPRFLITAPWGRAGQTSLVFVSNCVIFCHCLAALRKDLFPVGHFGTFSDTPVARDALLRPLVPRLRLGTHGLAGSACPRTARRSLAGTSFPGGAWERGAGGRHPKHLCFRCQTGSFWLT